MTAAATIGPTMLRAKLVADFGGLGRSRSSLMRGHTLVNPSPFALPLPPMLLHGTANWSSPYVLSCFVALREKGLAFTVKDVALDRDEHREASFARVSLTARVPLLEDGDFALSESSAIVEYLEEAFPAPEHPAVLPQGVRERARARQVMAWLRSDLMPIREERSSQWVFYPHAELEPFQPLTPAAQRAVAKLVEAAEQLVPRGGRPLFGAWCVADTDLAMMLQRLVKCGDPLPSRLVDYAEAQWRRGSVQEFCAHPRPPYRPMLP